MGWSRVRKKTGEGIAPQKPVPAEAWTLCTTAGTVSRNEITRPRRWKCYKDWPRKQRLDGEDIRHTAAGKEVGNRLGLKQIILLIKPNTPSISSNKPIYLAVSYIDLFKLFRV